MFASLRSKGETVLIVASSGVVALLILGGRTAPSRFRIPLNIDEYSTCEITPKGPLADLIRLEKLIIWDETPMMHKHYIEVVDHTLKDILRAKNIPFGGKIVVLSGDFHHILLIIHKGTRQEVFHSTINSSPLWSFCEVLTLNTNTRLLIEGTNLDVEEIKSFSESILGIGDRSFGDANDEDITIQIP